MSTKSQQANMKAIHSLVSQNLSYIHGEHECGPNGTKKQFLSKSAAFLRALGNDMEFLEFKVSKNPGGIAVSGEVTLMGMWSDGNGMYFQISQGFAHKGSFLYRHISHMKDYTGGTNQWLSGSIFERGDYENLTNTLSLLRKPVGVVLKIA